MKYSINLLSKKELSIIDKLVYFSLSYLRYVIVITQLIVIGVFFFRFKIDQNIIDLREALDQKKEIIQVVMPLLSQAESIDKNTKELKIIVNQQEDFLSSLNYLLSVFPETITLKKLDINEKSINMLGSAVDPNQLRSFYAILKKEGKFKSVNLSNIKKNQLGYSFAINLIKSDKK